MPIDSPESANTLKIKKSVGIVPVTRPTYRGSRIALRVETSNAEAHAEYEYTNKSNYP